MTPKVQVRKKTDFIKTKNLFLKGYNQENETITSRMKKYLQIIELIKDLYLKYSIT